VSGRAGGLAPPERCRRGGIAARQLLPAHNDELAKLSPNDASPSAFSGLRRLAGGQLESEAHAGGRLTSRPTRSCLSIGRRSLGTSSRAPSARRFLSRMKVQHGPGRPLSQGGRVTQLRQTAPTCRHLVCRNENRADIFSAHTIFAPYHRFLNSRRTFSPGPPSDVIRPRIRRPARARAFPLPRLSHSRY